jgi:hypothetical protein
MSPCLYVSIFPCLMSMSPCFHVSISMSSCLYVHVSMSMSPCPCLHVHVSMSMSPCPCLHVSRILQTENGTNRKRGLPFVCCKEKTETVNLRLFAADGNGKRKFLFLGRQMLTSNRRLFFLQTCPSMEFQCIYNIKSL